MDRIKEIEGRLAAINTEIDAATGDALAALESEVASLTDERKVIMAPAAALRHRRRRRARQDYRHPEGGQTHGKTYFRPGYRRVS